MPVGDGLENNNMKKYSKSEITNLKTYLTQLKADLQDPAKREMVDVENTRKFLAGLIPALEKQAEDISLKQSIAKVAGGLAILGMIIAWILGQPVYVQIIVIAVLLVSIGVLAYYIVTSKNPKATLLELVELAREIWEIINGLPIVEKPVADFIASPVSGNVPLSVTFTDRSTGSPTSWQWSFGDGSSSALQNPQHVYQQAGTYTVMLTVSNASGSSSKTLQVIATSPDPEPSQAPPGIRFETFGSVQLAKIGGEHQADMPVWLQGGQGWPAGTVRVMDSSDPDFDVLPNDIWAYWYDGSLAPKGWMISQQGYYYLKNTLVGSVNRIHSIIESPWVQPGKPIGIPLAEVDKIIRASDGWVVKMKNGKFVSMGGR